VWSRLALVDVSCFLQSGVVCFMSTQTVAVRTRFAVNIRSKKF
jgi:hypothetical protein